MARDPHSTTTHPEDGEVWRARIRTDTVRSTARPSEQKIDPLLEQRLRKAAEAASEAAAKATMAARAANQAVDLSELMDAFGARGGVGPGEVAEAAGRSIEAAQEALDESAAAEAEGHIAKLAAQDEAAGPEPDIHRHAGLGELWHR